MPPSRRHPDLSHTGLLIGRLVLGAVFVAHGWQKLTDTGHAGVTAMFDGLGIPLPGAAATFATWLELLGGDPAARYPEHLEHPDTPMADHPFL